MKRRILIVFIFLTPNLFGQDVNLSGKVLDSATNKPVEGATVFVKEMNQTIFSDQKGRYFFALEKGKYQLQVYSLGSEMISQDVILRTDTVIDFYLQRLSKNLDEVEIASEKELTSGMTRMRSIEGFGIYAAKKNEVIVLDDFAANLVSNNARQVFAKIPGLNIWESDFAGLQLDIAARGLGPSRTANFNTRQNGYDMSADALGYPESYYMPALQAVERIEIVRGAASLQYGTQFGGMLNFKLKDAPEKPLELTLEQSVGSFGLVNSFVSVGGTKSKIDYYAYYQYRRGDGWRENSGFEAHTAFARLGYQASEKLKLGFEYSYLYYEAQQPGGLTDREFFEEDISLSNRSRNWFNVNWNLFAQTIDYSFSSMTQLNVRTFGLVSSRNALGNLEQIGVPDNPLENRTLIRDEFTNFGTEVRLIHRFKIKEMNSALVVGGRYYNGLTDKRQGDANNSDQPDFEFLNPNDVEEFDYDFPSRNHALFVENLIDLNSRISVTAGVRLEHIRTDADGFWKLNRTNFAGEPRPVLTFEDESSNSRTFPLFGVGGSYDLTENLSLYGNISQNFRSITFSDLRVVNPNFQLDSTITDENGYNADIGVRGTVGNWLNMDVSVFLMRYNDRIGLILKERSTTLLRTNIGNSRHFGLESFIEVSVWDLFKMKKPNSRLTLFSNLALTEATYIESVRLAILNRRVEYVPEVMWRAGINYRWKNFKATYQFSHLGQQFSDATNSTFNPNALTGLIPSYQVMDLSLEYRPGKFKFTTGVNNLTNEEYFTRRAEGYPGPGIIPATIRSFYFSAGYTF
ncbi:MAG: TonB-dependent receptor [Flavobacteriales bacterium]|nr:TonB-dependent receptor [Flavobacteriales bacterium]